MTSCSDEDRDVDRLLRGETPAALADAAPAIARLRALVSDPIPADATRAGAALAAVAAGSRTPLSREPAAASSRWRSRMASASALALLVGGVAAGAAAADPAAPGDPLYELDLAFERIGLRAGGPTERVQEALRLERRGECAAAITHVATVAEVDTEASEALLAAAQDLRDDAAEASDEVHDDVAELLDWLASTDFSAPEFDAEVAARARVIHDATADAAPSGGAGEASGDEDVKGSEPDPVRAPAEDGGTAGIDDDAAAGDGGRTGSWGRDSEGWTEDDARDGDARWRDDGDGWRDDGWSSQQDEDPTAGDSGGWDRGGVGASPMPDYQSGSDQAFSPNRP
ncbi:hypothetical protein [Demequina mangrovi]|uniref:DUF5667 domain-containing protein n=1 Tax=Demequina mangrovi TaxID=1043493 RepID=A0A1H6VIU0_9MICO|nr:hypothetical protein [Demequina mangrovi]SEJ00650.1 hypothetical protein SAMN05421637_0714 [Demequina mangrovi]